MPALIAHSHPGLSANHANVAAVHAAQLAHVYRQLRRHGFSAQRRDRFRIGADAVAPRYHRHGVPGPDAGVYFDRARQDVHIGGVMARIAVQAAAFDAHDAPLDLESRQAAVGVALRTAGA